MTQYQFLDRRFQEYNAALMKALQNLANLLEIEKCWHQSKMIKIMLDIVLEIEIKNVQSIAAIEEDIKNSLLLD
ncbi:MAG: hypothetical protein HC836_03525 [Richelia sp. RM2_1_2]|nr:hypothetical protein [Richelia sp. SM2_1_7]NJM18968.1 hypothetical protein [Richelia sp. SM1_7_0]NJN07398.1 hypothetical protein [Richelia sp. RM1_1_1]NJO26802.1 hypothetical protein [Richelia sp. SL_2_1]NJO57477.1 hypothetical protein [Richelia sp. RM2_1_2]NJS16888.1 hypothetical protein [Nostocaceae cyanobacterium CSU_2_110]